jgi:hypothetical protein
MKKTFFVWSSLIFPLAFSHSSPPPWGFFAHQEINHMAVYTLPPSMIGFYKKNISFISNHASDPDKRKRMDAEEAQRHFMDMEFYSSDSVPQRWADALLKYGKDSLKIHGILPWHIEHTYYKLCKAFQEEDAKQILHYSSELGHYVGDAHVPLHATRNYNGQFTHQEGIHAFWESRVPELLSGSYDYFVGRATYLEKIRPPIWNAIAFSYQEKDSVLNLEAELNRQFPGDEKYSLETKGNTLLKMYSEAYTKAYAARLNGMVEKRMVESIRLVGSLWYTAWVNSGQPDLHHLDQFTISDSLKISDTLSPVSNKKEPHLPIRREDGGKKAKNNTYSSPAFHVFFSLFGQNT